MHECQSFLCHGSQVHRPAVTDGLGSFQHMLAIVAGSEGFDMAEYVSEWFLGLKVGEIGRENFADLMAYGFWYR